MALDAMAHTSYGCNRLVRHHELLHIIPLYLDRVESQTKLDETVSTLMSSNNVVQLLDSIWKSCVDLMKDENNVVEDFDGVTENGMTNGGFFIVIWLFILVY